MSNQLRTTEQNQQIQRADAPLSPSELVQQVKLIQEVMKSVMQEGQHYGKIPGCGPKPALFKPGAEKLQLTFRLHPDFQIEETDLPAGHKNFRVHCRLMNQAGGFQGAGVGYGSTRESKYSHKGGKETNPADYYNTVLKMAKKRAQVDAVLTCTAASDIFTQDLEDMQDSPREQHSIQGALPKDKFVENLVAESGGSVAWWGTIESVKMVEGTNAKGAWKLFWINLDDGQSAGTFDEAKAEDARIMIGQKVRLLVEPNKRKAGTWTYLGFETLEQRAAGEEKVEEELPWQ